MMRSNSDSRTRSRASEGEAKYINSPETPIFNKGSLLFGLDLARKSIRDRNEAVLVEGEFDVMSAWQIGVENVVAAKGTALTEKQVVTLSRLCENVILSFDEDIAGDAAARRGIELLDVAGMQVKVVRLGKHKDPDEFSQKDAVGFKNGPLQNQCFPLFVTEEGGVPYDEDETGTYTIFSYDNV